MHLAGETDRPGRGEHTPRGGGHQFVARDRGRPIVQPVVLGRRRVVRRDPGDIGGIAR